MELTNTQYGFDWGPVSVERAASDEKKGWAALLVKTAKYPHGIQVYVTQSGDVGVYADGVEWLQGQAKSHEAPP